MPRIEPVMRHASSPPPHARAARLGAELVVPLAVAVLALALTAPPSLAGSRRGSFDRPPFVHGRAPAVGPTAHLPVTLLAQDERTPTAKSSPALTAIVAELDSILNRIGPSKPIDLPWELAAGAPRIRFGCFSGDPGPDGARVPEDECDPRTRRMRFDVDGPSRAWREAARTASLVTHGVIVVQVSFGQY
jgi:hypothetical protein